MYLGLCVSFRHQTDGRGADGGNNNSTRSRRRRNAAPRPAPAAADIYAASSIGIGEKRTLERAGGWGGIGIARDRCRGGGGGYHLPGKPYYIHVYHSMYHIYTSAAVFIYVCASRAY